MISSYTVCGYCFENLDRGSSCTCRASQNKPTKLAVRYSELFDTQLNQSYPSIVGPEVEEEYVPNLGVPGDEMAVKIILSPEIKLCDSCLEEFQEAIELMAQIINTCMSSNGSKSLDESNTLIGKKEDRE